MREVLLFAPLLLAACAAAGPPVPGGTPSRACSAAGTDRFLGQPGTSETGSAILKATNSTQLRWAPPGTMLTMDYSPSRVTVRLGPDGRVIAINCG